MDRDMIFGRLVAIATVLGDRVFEKGVPSIAGEFLDKVGKNPEKYITIIHEKLMKYAHKFGPEEMALIDTFGELVAKLDISEFDSKPLGNSYLLGYYQQKAGKL